MRAREPDRLPCSPNWRAIKAGFQTFAEDICWGIGNGEKIKDWTDSWIRGSFLRELIEGPLTQREVDMKLSNLLLDMVQGWKWEALSFAGRAMLVKSVMSTIPNYVMQATGLPTHLFDKLDKINRDFCGDQQVRREEST